MLGERPLDVVSLQLPFLYVFQLEYGAHRTWNLVLFAFLYAWRLHGYPWLKRYSRMEAALSRVSVETTGYREAGSEGDGDGAYPLAER